MHLYAIDSEDALRSLYKTMGAAASKKKMHSRLYMHCKRFIELSLLLCIATARADGSADVSPRGDTPGFVGVSNDGTVVIPDLAGLPTMITKDRASIWVSVSDWLRRWATTRHLSCAITGC